MKRNIIFRSVICFATGLVLLLACLYLSACGGNGAGQDTQTETNISTEGGTENMNEFTEQETQPATEIPTGQETEPAAEAAHRPLPPFPYC